MVPALRTVGPGPCVRSHARVGSEALQGPVREFVVIDDHKRLDCRGLVQAVIAHDGLFPDVLDGLPYEVLFHVLDEFVGGLSEERVHVRVSLKDRVDGVECLGVEGHTYRLLHGVEKPADVSGVVFGPIPGLRCVIHGGEALGQPVEQDRGLAAVTAFTRHQVGAVKAPEGPEDPVIELMAVVGHEPELPASVAGIPPQAVVRILARQQGIA